MVAIHRMSGTLPGISGYDIGYDPRMTTTHPATIDESNPKGAEVIERLRNDRIGWLTTVASDGTPQTSPIWFLWSENDILVYSLDSPRARNIVNHPMVSLHLDGNGKGGDIVVIEGTATIDESAPPCADNPEYLAKYEPVMEGNGWTPQWFGDKYHVPIRITVTKYRYW
jgi:PPOX class probable F420-dependent enzyme